MKVTDRYGPKPGVASLLEGGTTMARHRKLPDNEELKKLLVAGWTQEEIARKYGVTPQAVSYLTVTWDIVPKRIDFKKYIPWQVKTQHHKEYERRMLRFYARKSEGLPLTHKQEGQVKLFTERLDSFFDGEPGVIDYTGEDDKPFVVVRRQPTDFGYARAPEDPPKEPGLTFLEP